METSSFPLLKRELRDLLADPWLFSLVSWIPLLLFCVMTWIFSQGVATDMPIGVVDLDKSRVSRSLIRHYEASPSLAVEDAFLDMREGVNALRSGTIYALIVLPDGLEEKTVRGWTPQVSAFVNNQFLLIGKIVSAALMQAQGTYTTKVEVVKNMAAGDRVIEMALSAAMPVGSQVTPLFNINKNYAQFLISAILPAIWQIIMVAGTTLSFAYVVRRYGLTTWLGRSPLSGVLTKMFFLSILFWLQGAFFLAIMYVWLDWPMHGDWSLLLVAQYVTVWACVGAGSLIFFLTRDAARSLSLAAAYSAPGLAFMGVTFPVTDMTFPAKVWRSLLPISHYIEIQFGQVNYGAPISTALPQLMALGMFIIPILLACALGYRMGSGNQISSAGESV